MTRILHVTDYYRPKVGGIEMFVEELAARQSAAGHDVTVLTRAGGRRGSAAPGPVEVIRAASWSLVPLPILPRGVQLSSYDVVHVHLSVACPFSTRVAQAAAALGVPVVATVHSLWTGREGWVRIIGAIAGWDSWPMRWTAVSSAAAQAMRSPLGDDTRVDVVPNAVDVGWWSACDPVKDESRTITFVSVMRLAGRKRPLPLLEAFAGARRVVPADVSVRLVLVGEGPLDRKVRARIDDLDLGGCVELTGELSRDEIRDLYRSADGYVAPSHQESFGIAALEARAAGLPVVAMRSGGVGEFVPHGTEGLLCDDDDDLARALVALAEDEGLRQRIAAHNRSIPPAMDWSVTLAGFQDAYRDAASAAREAGDGVISATPPTAVDATRTRT
jgi:glycosyltransferase involved in cell wall biosynthesis